MARALILAALAAAATACDASTPVALLPGPVSGFCQGNGPAIIVGDGFTVGEADGSNDDVCSGALARRTFRFALCMCQNYATSVGLETDSFASSEGPYEQASAGASGSVGINEDINTNADLIVRGSLWAGKLGATIGKVLTVSGDLVHGGGIMGSGQVAVGHDATIQGPVALAGSLTVGGKLIVPSIAQVSSNPAPVYGSFQEATVPVPDPCSCASGDLIDVTRFVNKNSVDNDNQTLFPEPLLPSRLAGFTGEQTLELPCGRYYLDTIDGTPGAHLTLRIRGRVVLFVGGSVVMRGPLDVVVDPDAELDLFVGGGFKIIGSAGPVHFGDPARPSKSRLYVGGSDTIEVSSDSVFAANLYAPLAALAVSAEVEMFGSIFVQQLMQSGAITLHYDTDVLNADQGCPVASTDACRTCLDCPAQACIGGQCGACTTSADCCPPLVCDGAGACVPPQ